MTEKWCGICQRRHTYQAYESPPARETFTDFAVAFGTWTLIAAAYISAALWVVSR